MDIIKPNSSYPSLHDNMHIYSGEVLLSTTAIKSVLIQTELRQLFYASFKAQTPNTSLRNYQSTITDLGYLSDFDALTGKMYFEVRVPLGMTLRYFIVGSDILPSNPVRHSELTLTTSGANIENQTFKLKIPAAGTGTVPLLEGKLNAAGLRIDTFVASHPVTGEYIITAPYDLIPAVSKVFINSMSTWGTVAPPIATVCAQRIDERTLKFFVFDDGGAAVNLGGDLDISFTIYP